MLCSPCLLHFYHPLASLSAECHQRTQGTRIISSVLGTGIKFGRVSVSTCWAHFSAVVEIMCLYCCVPFTNGLPWREGGTVVAFSETEALSQSNRNDLWTKVHPHPKEQVIVRGCFCFLPKPVVEGGGDERAMPNCSLSPVQAMLDCIQHWRPGRPFVHHWTCISFGTEQEMTGAANILEQVVSLFHGIETLGLPVWDLFCCWGIHILNYYYSNLTVGNSPTCITFKKPVFKGCCSLIWEKYS